jgi:hypothetical protein
VVVKTHYFGLTPVGFTYFQFIALRKETKYNSRLEAVPAGTKTRFDSGLGPQALPIISFSRYRKEHEYNSRLEAV